jgi:hypothetical protein
VIIMSLHLRCAWASCTGRELDSPSSRTAMSPTGNFVCPWVIRHLDEFAKASLSPRVGTLTAKDAQVRSSLAIFCSFRPSGE